MTRTADLELLFKDHYTRFYTLAFRLTGTRENAEDALQTAFLNAISAIDGFRGESALATWMYRIVYNAAKRLAQEAARLPVTVSAESRGISEDEIFARVRAYGPSDDEMLINRVRESCLQMFMNCMPPSLRAVYTLRGVLHFSVLDTAEILGISTAAVKTDLHRAKSLARDHFNGRCSLVKPGSRCDCRAFAKYLSDTGRTHVLPDVKAVQRRESRAKTAFLLEMREILGVDELYDTDAVPIDFEAFKQRIRTLRAEKSFAVLSS